MTDAIKAGGYSIDRELLLALAQYARDLAGKTPERETRVHEGEGSR